LGDTAVPCMSEPIFLKRSGGLTVGEIAALTGAEPPPAAAAARRIVSVAPLDRAGPSDLAFFDNRRFAAAAQASHAGACLTSAELARELPAGLTLLVVKNPYHAFVTAMHKLFPDALRPSSLFGVDAGAGVQHAHVHPDARLESGVIIDPGVVVGP